MTEHDHTEPVAGCFRCELSADEMRGQHLPGVPMCPDCGTHYVWGSARRGDREYWVASCDCMSKRFEAFLAKIERGKAEFDEIVAD